MSGAMGNVSPADNPDHNLCRKKLEPDHEKSTSSKVDLYSRANTIQIPEADSKSFMHTEAAPWSDSYDISTPDIEGEQFW